MRLNDSGAQSGVPVCLPSGFQPDQKSQVREVLNLLLCAPTDTPQAARKWFELFCESSDHLAHHQTQLEIELSCAPDNAQVQERISSFEQDILSLLLSKREELMKRYLESPYQTAMHEDDRGRIRQDFTARLHHSTADLTQLQLAENAITREYRTFVHQAKTKLFDKVTPLSVIVGRQSDRSEAMRKGSFEAYWNFVEQNENIYLEFFDRLARNRNEQSKIAQSASYEEFIYADLGRLDFDPISCAKLREHIKKHIVPVVVRLAEKQIQSCGKQNQDLKVKPWNSRTWDSQFPKELPAKGQQSRFLDNLKEACHSLHGSLASCHDLLRATNSLDIFPRAGKGSGAFCALRPLTGVPFVFGNFSVSTKDLFTLFHELGHAVHGFCSSPIRNSLVRSPGLEFCEFVSTTFEFLCHDVLHYFWEDPEQVEMAKRFHLYHSLTFLPFAAQMDEFQSRVYSQPDRACDIWSELGNQYRPQIDWSDSRAAERMGWCSRSHVFTSPFYYIDYAIAQIGSWQVYDRHKRALARGQKTDALRDFFASLSLGGQRSSHELFLAAGIRSPFEEDTIIRVAELIEEAGETF